MRRVNLTNHRFFAVLIFLLVIPAIAHAQQCEGVGVGVPYTCDLGSGLSQTAGALPASSGIVLTFAFTLDSASSLPPGLTLSPDGLITGTPTTAGTFQVTINFSITVTEMGSVVVQETIPIPFVIFITGATGETTIVDPSGLTFAFNQGDTAPSSQTVTLSNRSSNATTFTASATSDQGWLSVSPASGGTGPFLVSAIVATANPSGLAPGVYLGSIAIATADSSFTVPVVLTVTASQQGIKLSQTGLRFLAVLGGVTPPDQSVAVLNQGKGTLTFTTNVQTLKGGNWLTVSPPNGSVSPGSPTTVSFEATPKGLAAGTYYATVTFTAHGQEDSPATVEVVFNVFAPQNNPGPSLSSTGLIFVAQAGGQNPASQNVLAANPSPNPLAFATTPFSDSGTSFFTVQPSSGTITAGQPQPIAVQPALTGLSSGVFSGEIVVTFSDESTQPPLVFLRHIRVLLIVIPAGGSVPARADDAAAASACKPTKLSPVFTQLGAGFQVSAGWPTPLEVTVVDDCGNYTSKNSVVAGFSSGDPAIPLTSLNDGRWTATWNPHGATANQVTISVDAQQTQPALHGTAQIGGALVPNPSVPVVSSGGVVSAASNAAHQPIGPGSYISIYGSGFSDATHVSKKLPLPNSLNGTQVLIGGKPAPIYFTSTGQINAIVPFGVPVNTAQQLLVSTNGAVSVPEPIVLATAQPAIFSRDQTGRGLGVIAGQKTGSAPFLIDAQHPISAGDFLIIYCTGLGPVDQSVAAGSAGPSPPANTINQVTATIGGITASVKFSGLAPGLAVYQVNVKVPKGVPTGNSVPVVLTVNGLKSDPVTIVIK